MKKTLSLDDSYSKYADCMEEIKKRTEVIWGFLKGKYHAMYLQTTAESVALQIRKILELIALASLAANRPEYEKYRRDFRKDWNAKRIFETLDKANSRFYPKPTKQVVDSETGKVVSLEEVKSGFLTRQDYIALLDSCNQILHAENPFSKQKQQHPHVFMVSAPEWMNKIVCLLNHHAIQLFEDDKQLWVVMKAELDGKVYVHEFERVEEVDQ